MSTYNKSYLKIKNKLNNSIVLIVKTKFFIYYYGKNL